MNTKFIPIVFAVICVAQLAVPGWMIADRELTLRTGDLYKFRAEPVEPYDPFRGRYVRLRLSPTTAPAPQEGVGYNHFVYCQIEEDEDGFVRFSASTLEPPRSGPYLKVQSLGIAPAGNAGSTGEPAAPPAIRVRLPFDRYYMEEKLAPEAERVYRQVARERGASSYITIRIRGGKAVIEELFIDDLPIRDYLAR